MMSQLRVFVSHAWRVLFVQPVSINSLEEFMAAIADSYDVVTIERVVQGPDRPVAHEFYSWRFENVYTASSPNKPPVAWVERFMNYGDVRDSVERIRHSPQSSFRQAAELFDFRACEGRRLIKQRFPQMRFEFPDPDNPLYCQRVKKYAWTPKEIGDLAF